MPRPRKVDQALRELKKHDAQFQFYSAKGSHIAIWHPNIQGKPRSYTIPHHKGRDIHKCYLSDIIKRFELSSDFFG